MKNKTVRVNRQELLAKVKANKEKHQEEFKEAKRGYLVECAERSTKMLTQLSSMDDNMPEIMRDLGWASNAHANIQPHSEKKRDAFDHDTVWGNLIRPTDHSERFQSVEDMLEMSVDDTVELTFDQFNNYARNKWAWLSSFHSSTQGYSGKGRALSG